MNISEAHNKQAQLQGELQDLQVRLLDSIISKESSKEETMKLYHQIESELKQLHDIYKRLSLTVNQTRIGDKLFMEAVGDGKIMDFRINLIKECLDKAAQTDNPAININMLSKQLSTLQELKRDMESKIIATMEKTQVIKN